MGLLNVTIDLLNKYYVAIVLHIRINGVSFYHRLSLLLIVLLLMHMVVVLLKLYMALHLLCL